MSGRAAAALGLAIAMPIAMAGAANAAGPQLARQLVSQGRRTSASGWSSERRWSGHNDWEPNIAADPSSRWLYQMTTRYGAPAFCGRKVRHCIVFRSSPDDGGAWSRATRMPLRSCPPRRQCRPASAQNDPGIVVARTGVLYAAWMNTWDVVFMRSADHGRTWHRFHDFRRAAGLSFTDKPWIAISPSGRDVYVAFNSSDSYIAASHDFGRTWSKPRKTNADHRYWFAEGGAVAPDGAVYFAESAEHQKATGTIRLAVVSSRDGGLSWRTAFVGSSQQQPACHLAGCPNDFYGAQISLGVDRAGTILAAFAANAVPGAPMSLYAIRSADGHHWSAPTAIARIDGRPGTRVGADFPKVEAGSRIGSFDVAWEDDRNGAGRWNVWNRDTWTAGRSWSEVVRISRLGSGAPYQTTTGFRFPYGDYFGLTVDGIGRKYLTWSEGFSYNGPGNTWLASGL